MIMSKKIQKIIIYCNNNQKENINNEDDEDKKYDNFRYLNKNNDTDKDNNIIHDKLLLNSLFKNFKCIQNKKRRN